MTKTTTKAPAEYDDEGTSSECPEPNGFFADADQCDKYYACSDGRIEGNERLIEVSKRTKITVEII